VLAALHVVLHAAHIHLERAHDLFCDDQRLVELHVDEEQLGAEFGDSVTPSSVGERRQNPGHGVYQRLKEFDHAIAPDLCVTMNRVTDGGWNISTRSLSPDTHVPATDHAIPGHTRDRGAIRSSSWVSRSGRARGGAAPWQPRSRHAEGGRGRTTYRPARSSGKFLMPFAEAVRK